MRWTHQDTLMEQKVSNVDVSAPGGNLFLRAPDMKRLLIENDDRSPIKQS